MLTILKILSLFVSVDVQVCSRGGFCVPTKLVSLPEAGQGGVQTSTLLLVGTKLLQQLTHLLLTHVQQPLQGHFSWAHLLQKPVHNRVMVGFKENGGGEKTNLCKNNVDVKYQTLPVWPLSSGWRCGTSGWGKGSPPARRSAPLRPLCTYRTAGGWSTSPASPEDGQKQRSWGKSVRNTSEQNSLKTCEIKSQGKLHLQNHVRLRLAHNEPWPHDTASPHHCWQKHQQLIHNIFCPFVTSGTLHVLPMWTTGEVILLRGADL